MPYSLQLNLKKYESPLKSLNFLSFKEADIKQNNINKYIDDESESDSSSTDDSISSQQFYQNHTILSPISSNKTITTTPKNIENKLSSSSKSLKPLKQLKQLKQLNIKEDQKSPSNKDKILNEQSDLLRDFTIKTLQKEGLTSPIPIYKSARNNDGKTPPAIPPKSSFLIQKYIEPEIKDEEEELNLLHTLENDISFIANTSPTKALNKSIQIMYQDDENDEDLTHTIIHNHSSSDSSSSSEDEPQQEDPGDQQQIKVLNSADKIIKNTTHELDIFTSYSGVHIDKRFFNEELLHIQLDLSSTRHKYKSISALMKYKLLQHPHLYHLIAIKLYKGFRGLLFHNPEAKSKPNQIDIVPILLSTDYNLNQLELRQINHHSCMYQIDWKQVINIKFCNQEENVNDIFQQVRQLGYLYNQQDYQHCIQIIFKHKNSIKEQSWTILITEIDIYEVYFLLNFMRKCHISSHIFSTLLTSLQHSLGYQSNPINPTIINFIKHFNLKEKEKEKEKENNNSKKKKSDDESESDFWKCIELAVDLDLLPTKPTEQQIASFLHQMLPYGLNIHILTHHFLTRHDLLDICLVYIKQINVLGLSLMEALTELLYRIDYVYLYHHKQHNQLILTRILQTFSASYHQQHIKYHHLWSNYHQNSDHTF